jgi:hypothetical protein
VYIYGLVPQGIDSPLKIGELFHLGTELGKVPKAQDYPGWCTEEKDMYKWDCDQSFAQGMVQAHLEYWADENIDTIEKEREFYSPIFNPDTGRPTPNFKKAGKIDAIIRLADKRLALLERKTTSDDISPDSSYWRHLMMDQQISHYVVGAIDEGYDIETIVYDVVRKPAIKPRKIPVLDDANLKIVTNDETGERVINKTGKPRQSGGEGMTIKTRPETPNEFGVRVYQEMTDNPERYFARQEIPRLQSDIEEYLHELWQQQKMLNECHKNGYFFRNTASCFKWNKPCRYFDICTGGGFNPEDGIAPLGFEFREPHSELTKKGEEEDSDE